MNVRDVFDLFCRARQQSSMNVCKQASNKYAPKIKVLRSKNRRKVGALQVLSQRVCLIQDKVVVLLSGPRLVLSKLRPFPNRHSQYTWHGIGPVIHQ